MYFASDNSGPAHPEVLAALARANTGYAMPYGADIIMDKVRETLRSIFEAPEAAVYLVATGTAANALALATMCAPYETVFCRPRPTSLKMNATPQNSTRRPQRYRSSAR